MLYDGKETASIFLKNGYELELSIDTEAFDETISFEGNGAEQSNFLAKGSFRRRTFRLRCIE